MCGRFAAQLPAEFVRRLFATTNPLPNARASWNVAPSQTAMAIRRHPHTGERHLDLLQWGLVPHFTKDLKSCRRPINARAETAANTPMFRAALAMRRAIVPADAFYEWRPNDAARQPYAIARADGAPLAFAAVWESWRDPAGEVLRSFAILTTAANPDIAGLHHRMPVILEQAGWPAWLGETAADPRTLLRASPAGTLRAWPVSRRVNNVRNDGADLLEPEPQQVLA